jgi:hypothetical protein
MQTACTKIIVLVVVIITIIIIIIIIIINWIELLCSSSIQELHVTFCVRHPAV